MARRRYDSDLNDAEYAEIADFVERSPGGRGRPPTHSRRELIDAMLYVLRTGCAWRMLPHDFPPWQTVYDRFRRWERDGTWQRICYTLVARTRVLLERDPCPSAAILDSQAARTTQKGGCAPSISTNESWGAAGTC